MKRNPARRQPFNPLRKFLTDQGIAMEETFEVPATNDDGEDFVYTVTLDNIVRGIERKGTTENILAQIQRMAFQPKGVWPYLNGLAMRVVSGYLDDDPDYTKYYDVQIRAGE